MLPLGEVVTRLVERGSGRIGMAKALEIARAEQVELTTPQPADS